MKISRRDFAKLFGGVTGTLILGGFGMDQILDVPEELVEKIKNGPGIETWKNTICRQCPGGCGIRVRLIDDIPVFIKGNPNYPINQGGMCPLGRSGIEVLFNPDRIQTPLRRIGIPGSGKWDPITWDEALDQVSTSLRKLRSEGHPHEVAVLGSEESNLMQSHIERFMRAYGSPNYYRFSDRTNGTVPFLLSQGKDRIPAFDLLGARYILSIGANFLEEEYAPVYHTKVYTHLRDDSLGYRGRLVYVDSRVNITASAADRWIPIIPGTQAAFALGIAHVLIREELIDEEFIRLHTYGFQDSRRRDGSVRKGFRTVVLNEYYPERVTELTGIPSATILEIGRELGRAETSAVLGGSSVCDNANGTFAALAIHSLNALLGSFGKEGGVVKVEDPPVALERDPKSDAVASAGLGKPRLADSIDGRYPFAEFSIDAFAEHVISGTPYPLGILFLVGGNPLFQTLNHQRFREALREVPLIVSFSSFINESNEFADIVLPVPSYLESWDEVSSVPTVSFSNLGIQSPVLAPLFDSRPAAEIFVDLARRLGGTVAEAYSEDTFENEIKKRARGIYASGTGAIASESVSESWFAFLRQRGWQIGRYDSFDSFWKLLVENAGWWNPVRPDASPASFFDSTSRRFEFYLQKLNDTVQSAASTGTTLSEMDILRKLEIGQGPDGAYVPHYEPVDDGDQSDYPLMLTSFQMLVSRDGNGANQPLMQEMFGHYVRNYWRSWVELNPVTAEEYGVSNDEWIWVESAYGSVRVQTFIHPGIVPGVISIPFGLGHTSYGRYARGFGVNPYTVMKPRFDLISGRPALQATRVRISRVA